MTIGCIFRRVLKLFDIYRTLLPCIFLLLHKELRHSCSFQHHKLHHQLRPHCKDQDRKDHLQNKNNDNNINNINYIYFKYFETLHLEKIHI